MGSPRSRVRLCLTGIEPAGTAQAKYGSWFNPAVLWAESGIAHRLLNYAQQLAGADRLVFTAQHLSQHPAGRRGQIDGGVADENLDQAIPFSDFVAVLDQPHAQPGRL